ncbi:MAG: hypothetical protein J6A23_03010 [Thermoguttaceae bacterium]|nr:hypothetical protein [Thermoguttaceae bacterium]
MTRTFSFFTVLVCACIMALVLGCGGDKPSKSKKKSKPAVEQTEEVKAPEPVQAPKPKKEKKKKKKVKKEEPAEDDQNYLPPELQVQEKTLPAESAQWTVEDFTYIRTQESDLFDLSISELEKRLANPAAADDAAQILARFVRSVVPGALELEEKLKKNEKNLQNAMSDEELQESQMNRSQAQTVDFFILTQAQVRQAMTALARSTSEVAQQQTMAFLAGTLLTDENKTVLNDVIQAYADKAQEGKISPEEESILLSFLLTPELAVGKAAEFADVEVPAPTPSQEETPSGTNSRSSGARGNHPPILVAPGKRIQFKFSGGSGNMPEFTPEDVQKAVLAKYCPQSNAIFRARIARELLGNTVLEAANTEEKQAFLLNDVMDKFLMKKDFANCIAQLLIYRQDEQDHLDDAWNKTLEENLFLSHQTLMKTHYAFLEEKILEEYRSALLAKRNRLEAEDKARQEAEESASKTSNEQVSVSLLSRRAAQEKNLPNQGGNSGRPVSAFSPAVELLMAPEIGTSLAKELWTQEMRSTLFEKMQEIMDPYVEEALNNMPEPGSKTKPRLPNLQREDLQAVQIYLTIPCVETRKELFRLLDNAWLLGPEAFRTTFFDRVETEPGFLMVVKSLDRRALPKEKERPKRQTSNRKRPNVKKEPSAGELMREQRLQTGAAWQEQAYKMVCQWCWNYSLAAENQQKLASAARILDRNAPKQTAPKLPEALAERFPLPPESKVVAFYTNSDPKMDGISEKSGLNVTFFEVECTAAMPRLFSMFRSQNSRLQERGMPGKVTGQNTVLNGYWLERFELNDETGRQESLDILITPQHQSENARPMGTNEPEVKKGPADYRIYVLLMEMDDLTGEHKSNFEDEEGSEDRRDDERNSEDPEMSDDEYEE